MLAIERFRVLSLAVLLGVLAPATASAQVGQGAIRLGGDIDVLGFDWFPDVVGGFFLGVNNGRFAVNGGYQLTDAITIGARTSFGFSIVDPAGPIGESVAGSVGLLPYFEYMIPDPSVAPFFGAQAGFQINFPSDADAQAVAVAGAFGGIHLFATNSFSISPYAQINFLYNGPVERAGFELVGGISLIGYIGGGGASVTVTTPAAAPTTTTTDTDPSFSVETGY